MNDDGSHPGDSELPGRWAILGQKVAGFFKRMPSDAVGTVLYMVRGNQAAWDRHVTLGSRLLPRRAQQRWRQRPQARRIVLSRARAVAADIGGLGMPIMWRLLHWSFLGSQPKYEERIVRYGPRFGGFARPAAMAVGVAGRVVLTSAIAATGVLPSPDHPTHNDSSRGPESSHVAPVAWAANGPAGSATSALLWRGHSQMVPVVVGAPSNMQIGEFARTQVAASRRPREPAQNYI